jgi:cytochrome d ubiquinol oxidase subunit I
MFSMAMWMAAIVAPIQMVVGDQHGLNSFKHQPAKILALEGHFESYPDGAPFYVVGWPNDREQKMEYAFAIPKLGSLLLEHRPNAPLRGLDTIPDEDQPPAAIIFWSFRIMVGLAILMFALGLLSLWERFRRRLYDATLLHRFALAMGPAGFVATIAGWVTTEVGRQPYVIYGLMRTEDAVAPIAAPALSASLTAFVLVYFAVFGAGVWYILKLMAQPPHPGEEEPPKAPIRTAGITPSAALPKDAGQPRSERTEGEER